MLLRIPRVQKEAQIASDNGIKVSVIGRFDDTVEQASLQSRSYDVHLVNITRSDNENMVQRIIERSRFGYALFRNCINLKPDLIHANDLDTLPFAYYAGKKLGCPVVYDAHEIWIDERISPRYPLVKWLLRRYEKYLAKRVACVISVSNAAAGKLAELLTIARPVVITNCPYSLAERETITKNDGFEVLYHGIFRPGRGYEEFCMAAQELPEDITLVLRGYGPLEAALHELVDRLKLNTRVRFDEPVVYLNYPQPLHVPI